MSGFVWSDFFVVPRKNLLENGCFSGWARSWPAFEEPGSEKAENRIEVVRLLCEARANKNAVDMKLGAVWEAKTPKNRPSKWGSQGEEGYFHLPLGEFEFQCNYINLWWSSGCKLAWRTLSSFPYWDVGKSSSPSTCSWVVAVFEHPIPNAFPWSTDPSRRVMQLFGTSFGFTKGSRFCRELSPRWCFSGFSHQEGSHTFGLCLGLLPKKTSRLTSGAEQLSKDLGCFG